MDLNIKSYGQAGQGLQTIGFILGKIFQQAGMYVFASQFYLSRVRGGLNNFEIRISDTPIYAKRDKIDLLIALDYEYIDIYLKEIDNGIILTDKKNIENENKNEKILYVPFQQIAIDIGNNKLFENIVAIGAVLGFLCIDIQYLEKIIAKIFEEKGTKIIDINIKAAHAGYDYVHKNYADKCKYPFNKLNKTEEKMLINGNEAIGLGALAAGVKFFTAYPMTPSTSVLDFIANHAAKSNVIVQQAEDELSALNMVLGASYSGARAMTATSGGGFCLMVEALSLSGMIETPAVIYLGQRPGPATGLPTMTEQGELLFSIFAGHGEFARYVIAPKTPENAFYLTAEAFNIADKYQIPVIIIADQYLADSQVTCDRFDIERIKIEKNILSNEKLEKISHYKRYKFTDDGISPRALPMQSNHLVIVDSDEHNQEGHIDQSIENRIFMVDKRLKKINKIINDVPYPEIYGPEKAQITLIGWGSSYGPLVEAVDILNKENKNVNLVHFTHIYPLNKNILQNIFEKCDIIITVENNATAQFAKLLKTEIEIIINNSILRYDGLPFTPAYIIDALKEKEVI